MFPTISTSTYIPAYFAYSVIFLGGFSLTHTHTHTHTRTRTYAQRRQPIFPTISMSTYTPAYFVYFVIFWGGVSHTHTDTHTHAHTHGGDNPCFLRFQCRHTCQHTLHFSFLFFEDCSLTHAHAQAGSTAHVSYDFNVGVHSGIN